MKYSKEQVEQARKMLATLKPGDTVYTNVTHVARSGMSRRIRCYISDQDGIHDITWAVARVIEEPMNDQGLNIGGCGMDMCFHTVYSLSYKLFPDGFGILGKGPHGHEVRPRSEMEAAKAYAKGVKFRGRNGDTSGWDRDGGYALNKRDL